MTIPEERNGKVVVLRLTGMVDSEASRTLFEKFTEVIARGERYLLLDFREVNFINSTGLGALVYATRKVASAWGKLVLAGVTEPIQRIFKISGLISTLSMYSTEAAALGSFPLTVPPQP
jgi:anti-anti-sigma factor